MVTYAFLPALAILASTLCHAAFVPIDTGHLDPKCPPAMIPGFETNIFQYNIPAGGFYNKTGSFFHSEWYTGPLSSTHGKDNTVGSTRSGNYSGTLYTERLVGYSRSSGKLALQYTLVNPRVVFEGVTFTSYTEEMQIMSICGGSATYVSMTAVYCTDKVVKAYDLYDRVRRGAVGALAEQLDALVFAGTCPIGRNL